MPAASLTPPFNPELAEIIARRDAELDELKAALAKSCAALEDAQKTVADLQTYTATYERVVERSYNGVPLSELFPQEKLGWRG